MLRLIVQWFLDNGAGLATTLGVVAVGWAALQQRKLKELERGNNTNQRRIERIKTALNGQGKHLDDTGPFPLSSDDKG